MRDKRFIAAHRGGPLTKSQHRQLIEWSCKCVEHVSGLLREKPDERLIHALLIAKEWTEGRVRTGGAMKASVAAHAAARAATDPVAIAIARAAGHAVATAHMADHSLGGALYALKALKYRGQDIEAERKWQNTQLPKEIRELVLSSRLEKEKAPGIFRQ